MLGKPRSIEDLSGSQIPDLDIRKARSANRILIIDDKQFAYFKILKEKYEYRLTHIIDLEQVSLANEYEIVLCDMHGVGSALGGKSGGDVIIELRKAYPLKLLVAYTGHAFKAEYNRYYSMADDVVDKDIELSEWVEKLDSYLLQLGDPVLQWKRARTILFEKQVRTSVVMELENDFVKSFNEKKKLEKWRDSKLVQNLPSDAKTVILGVVTNLATRYFFGG